MNELIGWRFTILRICSKVRNQNDFQLCPKKTTEMNLEVKDMNTDCKQCLRPEAKKGMLRMPALNIDQNTISPLIQLAFMTAYKTSGEL